MVSRGTRESLGPPPAPFHSFRAIHDISNSNHKKSIQRGGRERGPAGGPWRQPRGRRYAPPGTNHHCHHRRRGAAMFCRCFGSGGAFSTSRWLLRGSPGVSAQQLQGYGYRGSAGPPGRGAAMLPSHCPGPPPPQRSGSTGPPGLRPRRRAGGGMEASQGKERALKIPPPSVFQGQGPPFFSRLFWLLSL